MSYALTYREPNRLPAGLLALAVHVAFISLLGFGMRWQAHAPEEFSVDLWDNLPVVEPVPLSEPMPPPAPTPAPVPAPVVKAAPPPPVKADIELREKKVSKVEPVKPNAQEIKAKQDQAIKAKQDQEDQRQSDAYAEQRRRDVQARVQTEVDAATAAEVGHYKDMIRSKIRRNIVMPPDVPESAVVEFKVTLLPGGMVMDVLLKKSSGITAYDNAAERAIYKAQPLPWPTDANMQKQFREFGLTIKPKEE